VQRPHPQPGKGPSVSGPITPGVPPHSVPINMPPEDQDGSGDDNDNFSGSGAGALPDITSSQTPSTWKDLGPVTTTATAPEPTSPDAIATATTILPTGEQPEGGGAVLLAEVEPGLTAQEKEATHPPSKTTLHPTTHSVSTARATMAPGPATSHPHRDVQPDHHETSAPTGRGRLEPHTPHTERRRLRRTPPPRSQWERALGSRTSPSTCPGRMQPGLQWNLAHGT
ncbi:hypothetical protein K5549_016882, partial [Capra hircus]